MIETVDRAVLAWIQAICKGKIFDLAMVQVTHFGDAGVFWIALAVLFLCSARTRKVAFVLAIAFGLDFLLCNVAIKPIVARPRPYEGWDIALLIAKPSEFSFPSGHSALSFAAVSVLWLTHFPGRKGFSALAVLIAFSRLYLYVHYPSDVLCGALLGALCGVFAYRVSLATFSGEKKGLLLRSGA